MTRRDPPRLGASANHGCNRILAATACRGADRVIARFMPRLRIAGGAPPLPTTAAARRLRPRGSHTTHSLRYGQHPAKLHGRPRT
jgi:hypothetical protein